MGGCSLGFQPQVSATNIPHPEGMLQITPIQGVMIFVSINLGLKPEAITSGSIAAK